MAGMSLSVSCLSSFRERSYTWVRTTALRCGTGVHQDVGYVPPGARTEEVSESIIPPGLRCETVEVSSENGHSLSGIVVSSSGASRAESRSSTNSSESPETLFFYLQGQNPPPRHPRSVLPTEQRLMSQGTQETHSIAFPFSSPCSITPPFEAGPV